VGNRNFSWGSVPPKGRSGGILLGIDTDLHEVLETECGTHFVRMLLKNKNSRIEWHLAVVYGPAQIEGRMNFWLNLHIFVTNVKARQLLVVILISSGKPVKKQTLYSTETEPYF
jgi:hypothetical protein